jgi:hypothetical protein
MADARHCPLEGEIGVLECGNRIFKCQSIVRRGHNGVDGPLEEGNPHVNVGFDLGGSQRLPVNEPRVGKEWMRVVAIVFPRREAEDEQEEAHRVCSQKASADQKIAGFSDTENTGRVEGRFATAHKKRAPVAAINVSFTNCINYL